MQLDIREIVRTIEHPNVVVLVHGQAGHTAHLPLVGKRLGPFGIVLVSWRGLRPESGIEGENADADREDERRSHGCEKTVLHIRVSLESSDSTP
jgi:hypothetical protein